MQPDPAQQTTAFRVILLIAMALAGALILYLSSFIQTVPAPQSGEYHYSSFFRNNYTILSNVFLCTIGFLAGFFTRVNPLLAGVAACAVFPVTAIFEAGLYKGSHNLIPFELAMYLLMAVPTIIATYLGRFAATRFPRK